MPATPDLPRRVLSLGPLVALSRARLRKVPSVRVGRWIAVLVAIVGTSLVVWLRVIDGERAAVDGFVVGSVRWAAWISAGLVALGAAHKRALTDRRDGFEVLGFARGYPSRGLDAARGAAAAIEAARAVALPGVIVGLAALASSASAAVLLSRLLLLAVVLVFALVSGATLGFLASLADRLRPSGGRGLFLAMMILPWALLDLVGRSGYSVPGALAAVLHVSLDVVGLGGLA